MEWKKLSRIKVFNLTWTKNPQKHWPGQIDLWRGSLPAERGRYFLANWKLFCEGIVITEQIQQTKICIRSQNSLGYPGKRMIIYSCFSHVLFSWTKPVVSFFEFLLAPGAIKMNYFFLENKLGFLWLAFCSGIESEVHCSICFKSASVFTAFCFFPVIGAAANGSEKFNLST